jgi:hypothetical protein
MNDPKIKTLSDCTVEELAEELARRQGKEAPRTLSEMEIEAESLKKVVGAASLEARLAQLGPEDRKPKACPHCGKRVRVKAVERKRTVLTLSGEHQLLRNYHYCETCQHGFYPRDAWLDLPEEGDLSHELEQRVLDFGVTDPFVTGAGRFSFHYGFSVSENLLRRVVDRAAKLLESAEPQALQEALAPTPPTPSELLVASTDGSMVPTRGEEPWKEAKLGVVYRDEHRVGGGGRRSQLSQARYAAVVGGVEELEKALEGALKAEEADLAKNVVCLGDGSKWIWNLFDRLCPTGIQVLDPKHALGQGMTCGRALLGEESELLPLWQQRLDQLLWTDDVDALVGELMACIEWSPAAGLKALDTLVGYYRNNQLRMDYSAAHAAGFPVGSGSVESGHRHVLQVRMKRSGQHWGPKRADAMARLRAAYRSTQPHLFHWSLRRAASTLKAASS